jgi:hypothetical protein
MKFLTLTLITHVPDPITGKRKSTTERLEEVVRLAVLSEELGFDGFATRRATNCSADSGARTRSPGTVGSGPHWTRRRPGREVG